MKASSFRVEDARGFWCIATSDRLLWDGPDQARLRGQAWASQVFHATRTVKDGLAVLRSDTAAIGDPLAPIHELYRPGGWSWPERES